VVGGGGATGAGPEIAGRIAGVISGTPSSFAGVVLEVVAGVDFEVEVVGLVVGGFETAGFEPGAVVVAAGWKGVGVTDGVGGIGTWPAAKLNAASDSATKQTGRSTRYV
jgi:hypothetical protein